MSCLEFSFISQHYINCCRVKKVALLFWNSCLVSCLHVMVWWPDLTNLTGLFQKFCNVLAAALRAFLQKDKHLIHPKRDSTPHSHFFAVLPNQQVYILQRRIKEKLQITPQLLLSLVILTLNRPINNNFFFTLRSCPQVWIYYLYDFIVLKWWNLIQIQSKWKSFVSFSFLCVCKI